MLNQMVKIPNYPKPEIKLITKKELNLELMCKVFADTWNNSDNKRILSAWCDTSEDIRNEIRIAMKAVIDTCINKTL